MIKKDLERIQETLVGRGRFYSPFKQHTENISIVASLLLSNLCSGSVEPELAPAQPRPRSAQLKIFSVHMLHPELNLYSITVYFKALLQ